MARCLIGCGSNLGDRREQLDRAVELLRFMPGISLVAVSRYRETRPIGGPAGQGPFLNGACLVDTVLPPQDVLGILTAVENTLERARVVRWGERSIDLDLLVYDDVILDSGPLTIPHPRMATRRFVLEPCVEIAPEVPHPVLGCTLRDLLATITAPGPLVAVVGVPGAGVREILATMSDTLLAPVTLAPLPPPRGSDPRAWHGTADAWAATLATLPDDGCHPLLTDCWLDMLPLAAVDQLTPAEVARLERHVEQLAGPRPQVALLLTATTAALEERCAFHRTAAASDVFGDVAPAATVCGSASHLERLQQRLVDRLLGPARRPDAPPAVVTVAADDLAQAADEAIAAVEAMS